MAHYEVSASGWVHIEVAVIVAETEKAFLCTVAVDDDEYRNVWLPKSQMESPEDYEKGDKNLSLAVSEFIAREKELID